MRGVTKPVAALALLLAAGFATAHPPAARAQEEPDDAPPAEGPGTAGGRRERARQEAPRPAEDGEVDRLVRALGAETFADRERATERLTEIGKPAHAALREALKSEDAEVRYRARLVLRAGLRRVTTLLERLTAHARAGGGEEDPGAELVKLGADAVEHLAYLLRRDLQDYQGEDERIRMTIAVIGEIGKDLAKAKDPRAAVARDALLSILDLNLRNAHDELKQALVPELAPEAARALAGRLADREPLVRQNAIKVLGLLAAEEGAAEDAVAALASALDDKDPNVRAEAIRALAQTGRGRTAKTVRASAGDAILRALDDSDRSVETAAIRALAELRERRAIPHLRTVVAPASATLAEALKSGAADAVSLGDEDRLAAAIEGLGLLDDRESIAILRPFARASFSMLVAAAADALGLLRAREAVPDLVALLGREDTAALVKAIGALGRIGDPAALEPLKTFYRSRNLLRPKVLVAIGKLDTPAAAAFLLERARESEDESEVRIALDAIARRADGGDAQARADLGDAALAALARPPVNLKQYALRLIARVKHRPAVEKVIGLASSPDSRLASEAIETLGAIGDRRAVEPLKALVGRNADDEFQRTLARSLAKLGDDAAVREWVAKSEAEVARAPDDLDAQFQLGLDYLYAKENAKGAAVFATILEKDPNYRNKSVAAYNLACGKSLLGEKEAALAALRKSVELGFDDWRHMEQDTDLDPVRDDEEFKRIISGLKRAGAPKSAGRPIIINDNHRILVIEGDEEGEE